MAILLKRAYDPPSRDDGLRILVERLWPRGVSRSTARIDAWVRDAAPSTELRRWFSHRPERWPEFKRRYFRELDESGGAVDRLRAQIDSAAGPVTFVYASREMRFNAATALREYLEGSR
ncbi:MAG: DUF488 family protein [Spirochaetaceae bacterium]|nr:DUF488 family protein [Myxococcales bacterium]MCB9725885.1 DUF488 family protein [Spirochaetaceae bacterium]HPG27707.1 DUF488 family protein [Myxococcota bacterium]